MAEKRMISKVISISKKFNIRVDDHFSRLLYVLLIPHSDDFGRLTGCPHKVKALIIPMMNDTWENVETALSKLHEAELILWYEVDGEKYIQLNNFEEHQQGLHKRTRSKFPEPPSNSRNFPEIPSEGKGTEGNRTEENGREQNFSPTAFDNPHQNRINACAHENDLTGITFDTLEDLFQFIGKVDLEVIEYAINKGKKKHINYAVNTIHGLMSEGKTTKESINKLQLVPGSSKKDPELEARHIEIQRNRWIEAGGKPDEFRYQPVS